MEGCSLVPPLLLHHHHHQPPPRLWVQRGWIQNPGRVWRLVRLMEMKGPVSRRQSGPEVRSSKRTAAHLSPDPRRRGRGAARRAPRAARQRCEDRARARLASLGAVRPKLGPAALQQPSLRVRLGSLFGDGFCPRGGGRDRAGGGTRSRALQLAQLSNH